MNPPRNDNRDDTAPQLLTALLIPVGQPARLAALPRVAPIYAHRPIQKMIGGFVEAVPLTSRCVAWVDDNGIALDKPLNPAGTILAEAYGWYWRLYGTVVVTGRRVLDDGDWRITGLSDRQVGVILRKISGPATARGRARPQGAPGARA